MATSIKLKGDIKKIEAAINSKATPKSLVPKLQAQLDKLKSDLASLSSPKPKKGVTKTKVLSSLQKLKAKIKTTKSLSGYKKSGIDIKKDADVPALPLGRRTAKTTGNTYYEYRLNRADVKQPPKRYPKLEDGGYMAKGGKISDKQMQRLDSGYEFIIYTDLPRQYGQYHISMAKENGDVVYIVKSGHVASSKKVKTFTSEKDAFDYLTNKFGVKVSKKKMNYEDGGKLNNKYNLSFNYNPSNLSNVDAERIVTKYTKNWKHDNDFDEVSFYVFNLTKEDANMLSKELKMENVYNIELDYSRYEDGGMMADGGELKVGDKVIFKDNKYRVSKITNENVGGFIDAKWHLDSTKIGVKDVVLDSPKGVTKISDSEYMANRGYMADGGMMEKGGIYSSDNVWVVTFQNQYSGELEEVRVSSLNNGNKKMSPSYIAMDKQQVIDVAKQDSGLSSDWQYYSAEKQMDDGGMMDDGGKTEEEPKVIRGYSDDEAYEYAKGGLTQHGLKQGDMIMGHEDNNVVVKDRSSKIYIININNGTRLSEEEFNKFSSREKTKFSKMAQGGRTTSAINRDRAYKSNQPWEQNYSRKSRPKNPKYNTSSNFFEGGGEMHRLFDEGGI